MVDEGWKLEVGSERLASEAQRARRKEGRKRKDGDELENPRSHMQRRHVGHPKPQDPSSANRYMEHPLRCLRRELKD